MTRFTLDQIRDFWQRQALEHGLSPSASWSDHPVMEMEIREIARHLNDGDRVLDVGCANGYSTVRLASERRVSIRGIDYIPEMIEEARKRLIGVHERLQGSAEFDVGDILDLREPVLYDKVIVIRVLINLGTTENQLLAIQQCARVIKPGGLLLVSEATVQGWQRLNTFRRQWGLNDISMPPFNHYIDEVTVRDAAPDLELLDIVNFASSYYVGTRVLKPLLVRALGANVAVSDPSAEWNRFWSLMPPAGDYGTQKLFVLRKRDGANA